jgi:hypothetical protein
VSVRSKPLSESSSGSEIEGLRMAVNDEGKVPSGVPAPVGDGGGEEKKDETEGDAKETPASKVAVDRNTELLLWPSASASSGSSKDTGTEGALSSDDVLGSSTSSSTGGSVSSMASCGGCVSTEGIEEEEEEEEEEVVGGIARFGLSVSEVEGSSSEFDSLLTTSPIGAAEGSGAEVGSGSGSVSGPGSGCC